MVPVQIFLVTRQYNANEITSFNQKKKGEGISPSTFFLRYAYITINPLGCAKHGIQIDLILLETFEDYHVSRFLRQFDVVIYLSHQR